MDWKWIIPIALTVGTIVSGGVWTLVQLVARLVAEATELKVHLKMVVPIAAEVPDIKQAVAIHTHVLAEHKEQLGDHKEQLAALRSAAE